MKIRSASDTTKYVIAATFLCALAYRFWLREEVVDYILGNGDSWIGSVIDALYPRFQIIRLQKPPEFLIAKADQIIVRMALTSIVFLWLRDRIPILFNRETTPNSDYKLPIKVFYFGVLCFAWDWHEYLIDYHNARLFFEPISFYRWLGWDYPNLITIEVVWALFVLSIVFVIAGIFPLYASIATVVFFIYIQGLFHSFGKFNHAYALVSYVLAVLPCYQLIKGEIKKHQIILFIRLIIVLAYFFSGLEKLVSSSGHWFDSTTLESYIRWANTPEGNWMLSLPWLLKALAPIMIGFQLGFIAVLFYPRLTVYWIVMGIAFHTATVVFIRVGSILNPWVMCYIFLIDWKDLLNRLQHKFNFQLIK